MDEMNVLPQPVDPAADVWASVLSGAFDDSRSPEELAWLLPPEEVQPDAGVGDQLDPDEDDAEELGAWSDMPVDDQVIDLVEDDPLRALDREEPDLGPDLHHDPFEDPQW